MGGSYRPRPKSALVGTDWPSILGDFNGLKVELFARFSTYRDQIRDFSVVLWVVEDEQRYEVECVDCCDGELHRHRLVRSRPKDRNGDRHLIKELNEGDERVVNSEFDVQYDWMVANWESCVRRWDRG